MGSLAIIGFKREVVDVMEGRRKWFLLFRIMVAVICLSYISFAVIQIPTYYDRLEKDCVTEKCFASPSPPPGVDALQQLGINESIYALFYTVLDCVFIFVFLVAAFMIYWKKGHEMMGLLGAIVLVTFGITFPSLVFVAAEQDSFLFLINDVMSLVGWSSLCLFFVLFPNGRFVPKWSPYVLIAIGILLLLNFIEELPPWVMYLRLLVTLSFLLYAQIHRYRKVSSQVERQQTKWVVFGFSGAIFGFLCLVFIPLLFDRTIFENGSVLYFMFFNSSVYLFMLLIPVSITFALLRRKLWDIDPLLNRTFVYAIMLLVVIGIYVAVVWYLSNMFKTDDHNLAISIIATSIVAVSFSPIKEKVQQMLIYKMYGEQGNPYFVLALLGKKIQELQTPEQVLDQVVQTLKEILRLPYASIQLLQNNEEIILAQYGESQSEVRRLPIMYRGTMIGCLLVAPRSPGEAFTKADEKLWEVLIQQLGPLLQDLKATEDVKALNRVLQTSRERLVLAREEERHFLRRNLHDDLAPRLAALAYTAAAAEDLVEKDPQTVKALLAEHQRMILGTVDDIRRLVYDLRPAAIDELGLVAAVKQRMEEVSSIGNTSFSYELPIKLEHIPPAVEVAVFRIISEGVVNVVRHAQANHASVSLVVLEDRLVIEICDDGIGLMEKKEARTIGGLGVPSMKERAAELGGELTIERMIEGGTRISAWIPLIKEIEGERYENDTSAFSG